MSRDVPSPTVRRRHKARRLAVWNGAVWAIGNGLAGTTLVIYLARELNSDQFGLSIGLILAAPHLAGLLRLAAPAMIARLGDRKRFCAGCFLLSALTLSALPWICSPGRLPTPGWSSGALIALWCVYHLLQYLGTVALWSWLADVADRKIRGRFFGVRERWMVAGTAVAAIGVGLFIWGVKQLYPTLPGWLPYATASALGAGFMFAAVIPLCLMPAMAAKHSQRSHPAPPNVPRDWKTMLAPLIDRRFLPLLFYGCWFSLFNGVTQSAQRYFPIHVLGLPLVTMLSLETGSRLGRWGVSPKLGAIADRRGNRPVMIGSQLLVAVGMLFFAAAAMDGRWLWLIGAWIMWIAYAGLNVCMPNLVLKLAPRETNASYIAAFDSLRGVCYAVSAIVGGWLVDTHVSHPIGLDDVWFFSLLFIFGWGARSLGAAVLLLIREPKS